MKPAVKALLDRLMTDVEFADRYFSAPGQVLNEIGLEQSDREALASLDREAVQFMAGVEDQEPQLAREHPANNAQNRWVTSVIALWGCAAYVFFWLLFGGAQS